MHSPFLGTLAELWRYPVKSMRGEALQTATLDAAGMVGDRRFAVTSSAAPAGKPLVSSRERTRLLRFQPRLETTPHVLTPDGNTLALPSTELLTYLQQYVADPGATLAFEHTPATPRTDVRPLSLISETTLTWMARELGASFAPQRLRHNLILALADEAPFAEEALAGKLLQLGEGPNVPVLRLEERIPRCRIVSLDPVTAETDTTLLRYLAQHRSARIGMYATVVKPGTLSVGAPLKLLPAQDMLPNT